VNTHTHTHTYIYNIYIYFTVLLYLLSYIIPYLLLFNADVYYYSSGPHGFMFYYWVSIARLLHWMNRLLGRVKKNFTDSNFPLGTSTWHFALCQYTLRIKFHKSSRRTDRHTIKYSDPRFIKLVNFLTRC